MIYDKESGHIGHKHTAYDIHEYIEVYSYIVHSNDVNVHRCLYTACVDVFKHNYKNGMYTLAYVNINHTYNVGTHIYELLT